MNSFGDSIGGFIKKIKNMLARFSL